MRGETAPRSLPAPLLVALGCVQAIWPLTMDLYLPAFPQIASELDAAPALVQLTLTAAFIGMAIGQLAAGPLSDRVGRSRPLVAVLILYAISTAACALVPTIEMLVAMRAIQGLGAAASSVVVLAIVRDTASGPRMVRLLARLQLINGAFVVASPALGAQLLRVLDWRGLFVVLFVYAVILVTVTALAVRGRETLSSETRSRSRDAGLRADIGALFHDRRYLAMIGVWAICYGSMMSYMAASAFLFQDLFGLDATGYAVVFGAHGAVMIAGTQLSARLAARVGVLPVLRSGAVALAAAGCALLLGALFRPDLGLWGFITPLLVFTAAFGLLSPVVQSTALADHGARAGTAASLLGASTMVAGAVLAPVVGAFGLDSAVPVGVAMASGSTLALLIVLIVFGRRADLAAPADAGHPQKARPLGRSAG